VAHQLPSLMATVLISVTHPCSMTSRPLPASGLSARRLACRRRALEVMEKLATASLASFAASFGAFLASLQELTEEDLPTLITGDSEKLTYRPQRVTLACEGGTYGC
jgi:hypothetical protein